ncbi:acyl carrier protein [uncultured Gemmiger sp.]|uniref:acyl carrier protein n=1 Tax=uncultured Gemmiger sp. TaxID=1623490 RepID=UPI0025D1415C|nr:acyl carrier protein [uncultured Gemmiger sp.]
MHTNEEILKILAEVKPGLAPAPDTELIKSGLLDSVEVMQLVMALGEEFDIEITPTDLREENFHTVAAICALVNRLEEE